MMNIRIPLIVKVWRGLRMCGLAVAAFVLLLALIPEVLLLAAWYGLVRNLPSEEWPEPWYIVKHVDMLAWLLRYELGLDVDTHSEHPYYAGESNNNKKAEEAIMNGKYGEEKVKELEELKDMMRELVDMVDTVEESDSGATLHPTHFSSCRTLHVEKFNELWPKIEAAVRPCKPARKAPRPADDPHDCCTCMYADVAETMNPCRSCTYGDAGYSHWSSVMNVVKCQGAKDKAKDKKALRGCDTCRHDNSVKADPPCKLCNGDHMRWEPKLKESDAPELVGFGNVNKK